MQREVLGSKSTNIKDRCLLYVIFTDLDEVQMCLADPKCFWRIEIGFPNALNAQMALCCFCQKWVLVLYFRMALDSRCLTSGILLLSASDDCGTHLLPKLSIRTQKSTSLVPHLLCLYKFEFRKYDLKPEIDLELKRFKKMC